MTDMEFRKAFGGRVKASRKQRGWTQKELAGRLGLHFQLLNKYEGGQTLPNPEKLVALAEELEVSLDFLLTGRAHGDQGISDQRILERFQAMDSFPPEDQEAIFRLIDAVSVRHSVEGSLQRIQRKRQAPEEAAAVDKP